MELRNYLEVLSKRWTLVAGVLLFSVLVSVGVTFLIPPTYEADTKLFVSTQTDAANPNQQLFQGGSFSVDRVKSYAELATSPKVTEPVREELGLDPSSDIAGNIQATVPTGTVLLELRVTNESAQTAADLTNAAGAQLGKVIEELETPATGPPSPVKVSILKQAVPPVDPVWPSLPVNLAAGLLIGLILGVGIALVLESLDVTVKDADDLASVTPLPILATVVYDPAIADQPIARGDLHDTRSEAYRQLRTNLQFAFVDDKPGVLVVTSALPGEGKSSVAGNLATSLQQLGWTVCLVDGDLRRPSVAEYFGLVAETGLTTALIGRAPVGNVVQSAAPGFDVLTSGTVPPNPGELLASERMTAVLAQLSDRYDMVIVDAPPTLPVADAAALASRADGTLFVVSVGNTTRPQVQLGLENLDQVKARVLGVVLNKAPARGSRAGYYDYGSTYRPKQPASSDASPVTGTAAHAGGPVVGQGAPGAGRQAPGPPSGFLPPPSSGPMASNGSTEDTGRIPAVGGADAAAQQTPTPLGQRAPGAPTQDRPSPRPFAPVSSNGAGESGDPAHPQNPGAPSSSEHHDT